MTAVKTIVTCLGWTALLIVAAAMPVQAMTATQLGARQLTATSANIDLTRLHNRLCDILAAVHEIDGRASPCQPPCRISTAGSKDDCKEEDNFDRGPSAKLLLDINDSPRQALLDFIRMTDLFCDAEVSGTDPDKLLNCWNSIPDQLEKLRQDGETLYAQAAGADGGGTDDTSRVARAEAERAIAAVAAVGQSWGWQQRPKPEAAVDGVDQCGARGAKRPIPKELIDAIRQMAAINTGPKMKRAEDLFPDLRQAIDDVIGLLNSKNDPSEEDMDRLCKFAAAADARTNGRLANYYTNPTSAGALVDKATEINTHRNLICREHLPADEHGLCAVEPGDYAIAFSGYIRASLSSWNNANLVVKRAFPKIRDGIGSRLAQDKAAPTIKAANQAIRLALVAANLMAGTLDKRDANGGAIEGEMVPDEGRSQLSLLLSRLKPPKTDEPELGHDDSCEPLRISSVVKDSDTLGDWLATQVKAIDEAKGQKGDALSKAVTADEVRNQLIAEARARLSQALPDDALAAVRKAADQLAKISDRLILGQLSASGSGLSLAATLQRACWHGGKIDIEMTFSLVPVLTRGAKVDTAPKVSGVPFMLPLRRSLLISLDVLEFQNAVLAGTLEASLKSFTKENIPKDFGADMGELCSLSAALGSSPDAAEQAVACRWPAAIQIPSRVQISFSPDFSMATFSLPEWTQALLPAECPSSITIGAGDASAHTLIDCFSKDLKANALDAMLGTEFIQLKDTALKAVNALKPQQLVKLIDQAGPKSNDFCQPKVAVTVIADSDHLANIHQSVLVQPQLDDKGNLIRLPARVPMLQVTARFAVDDCLKSSASKIPPRLAGIWSGTTLQWSQTLEVNLPGFSVESADGKGASDPLDAWVGAIAALQKNIDTPLFTWDSEITLQTGIDRNVAASALLASDHLELCTTSDGTEELYFYFSPLSDNGGLDDAPCSPERAPTDARLLPPLLIATGPSYRSLAPASELINSIVGPLTAKFASSVTLHMPGAGLDFGAPLVIADEAKFCAPNFASSNRLSFDIESATFDSAAVNPLPLLHVIVGWEPDQPASLSLVADKPIDQLDRVIASVAHVPVDAVKVMGLAVAGSDLKPCVVGPKQTILSVALGSSFVEELLSSDVTQKIGNAADVVSNLQKVASFIRDKQPWTSDLRPIKDASNGLLLRLQGCSGKEKNSFVTCDYTIAVDGCPIKLRIDATRKSLTFKGSDFKSPPGCAPEALGTLFGNYEGGPLPFTLSSPTLIVSDRFEFTAQLSETTDKSTAAVNACLATLDLAKHPIQLSADSAGAVSLTIDPSVKNSLTQCAIDYAAGKVADSLVSAGLDPDVLTARIDETIRQWIETSNGAMGATCKSISTGPLICKPVTVAEAAKAFPSAWSEASSAICALAAVPIATIAEKEAGKAQNRCMEMLAGNGCANNVSQICSTAVGFEFVASFDLPGGHKAEARAHYLPPKTFAVDSCFEGDQSFNAKYLDIAFTPACKDGVLRLTGTMALAKDFPIAIGGAPVPISAPISLSADLRTGRVSANIEAASWQGILSAALSRAINGKKLEANGSTIEVTDASINDKLIATVTGTLMLDYGEHIELPGFKMTVDLTNGKVSVAAPDASAAAGGLFKRLASSISIPGALEVKPGAPVFENGKFKSISATVTIQGGVFKATPPPMIFDRKGVRFGDPFSITLVFAAEIPIPPLALTNIRGTISEKFLSLGADATLAEAAMAYLVKATGDFTLPFDLHDDITAIEQMVVFTVIPLGKSTTVINIHGPVLSRTIEIGGALKPIIWLFGEAKLDGKKITGNTNLALFGIDLAHSDLDADLGSGRVSATGKADFGIGDLQYQFNGKQFTDNMRLQMNGRIHVGKFNLSDFNILATPSSAAVKFKVLGISLGFVTPRVKDITSDMLEKMIEKLFSFNLKDLGKALEAILSGNLTINPYSHFGKNAGNGVASGDGSGSEGRVDGEDGSANANGGGATGAVPGAATEAAKQTPQGAGNKGAHDRADVQAKAKAEDLRKNAAEKQAVEGATKPLLNPEGEMVMQFSLASNGAEQRIVGDMVRPGQESVAPLLTLKKGEEPKTYFAARTAPQLAITPTPVLLERGIFVASEASWAPFLPEDHRNENASPIQGLCAGSATELDLLLFADNSDANAPKRLPAGLLGLCMEGLEGLAAKNDAADLLLAALRVAAITLPKWPEVEIKDKTTVTGPLKATWFQCEGSQGKGLITGLSMLITGELASRVILRDPDGVIRYFRMSGFPYGTKEVDAKDRVAACLLLDKADQPKDGVPFDFISLSAAKDKLVAGRTPAGEFKFDGLKWGKLNTDEKHPLPPIVSLISPPDPKDQSILQAIKDQNEDLSSRSGATKKRLIQAASLPGGHHLCVVNQNGGIPSLAEREGGTIQPAFMKLLNNGSFAFPPGMPQITFPPVASDSDPDGCSIPASPAPIVIYDSDPTPGIARFMRGDGTCAIDFYWTDGDTATHSGFELSPTLCSTAKAATTDELIFNHDMFWVVSRFMSCMDDSPNKPECVPDGLKVGGGWSDKSRVVIATSPRGAGVNVWAGPIEIGQKRGTQLTGDAAALERLLGREWTSRQVDVFADWFARNTSQLFLLQSTAERLDFMAASSVLRINLAGDAPLKTEIDFTAAPGLLVGDTIRRVLQIDSAIPPREETARVALISDRDGILTFAVHVGADEHGPWQLWQNGSKMPATLASLSDADLVVGLGPALSKLGTDAAEISISRNASALLAATKSSAFVADQTGTCAKPLLSSGGDDKFRQTLLGLWMKDFSQSPLTVKAPCGDAAITITSRQLGGDGVTVVDYPALVLNVLPASHVLAADGRTMTVLRRADFSSAFQDAANRATIFGLDHLDLGDHLELLGEIGTDRVRFTLMQNAGLAGPQFACPFENAAVFSQISTVLNEYLASIDKQCQKAQTISGADIVYRQIATSRGGIDVVIAPTPDDVGTWSVFFGDGRGLPKNVQSTRVTVPANDSSENSSREIEGLVRSWIERGVAVGRGNSFSLKHYPPLDCTECLAVVTAKEQSQVLAAALSGSAADRFLPLGGSEPIEDPLAALDQPTASVAVDILRSDLERLSSVGSPGGGAPAAFCVVKAGGITLWPNLAIDDTLPYEQRYHAIVAGKDTDLVSFISAETPSCQSVRAALGTGYHENLKLTALVKRPNGEDQEVWFAEKIGATGTTFTRRGAKCELRSVLSDVDIFNALSTRPQRLDCPERVLKEVITDARDATPRLAMTVPSKDYGSLAWIDGPDSFKAIGLIDAGINYSEAHWRLIEDLDLSVDPEKLSFAVALGSSDAPKLLVARPNGEITSRAARQPARNVRTVGFPNTASNPAVLSALRQWANSKAEPQGLVFPSGDRVAYWFVNSPQSATVYEDKPGSMWTYPIKIESAIELGPLMSALHRADQKILDAIEDRSDEQYTATLRIENDSLAVVGQHRLVLQSGAAANPLIQVAIFDTAPPLEIVDRIVAGLRATGRSHCAGQKPCALLLSKARFALLDGSEAVLDGSPSGKLGHATIIETGSVNVPSLIGRVLDEADITQLETDGGIVFPIGDREGLFVSGAGLPALFFDAARSMSLKLRPRLADLAPKDLAIKFGGRDPDFVSRLAGLSGAPSIGMANGREVFACTDKSLVLFDGSLTGTITATDPIEPFCAAIETSSFHLDGDDALSLMPYNHGFLLFKPEQDRFKVRFWKSGVERALDMPFSPADALKPSLRNDIIEAALDCGSVERIAKQDAGLALVGKPTQWACSITLGSPDAAATPLLGPTLFLEHPRGDGVAPAIASTTISAGQLLPRTSEVLEALATRILANCKNQTRIPAESREATTLLSVVEGCDAVIAWLPKPSDPVQTISGDAKQAHSLWAVLGTRIKELSGSDLHLDEFLEGKGAALATTDLLTVAPLDSSPVSHAPIAVETARDAICASNAIGARCTQISAKDIAKAALAAKDIAGGRRIPYAGDPRGLVWPVNVWSFWLNIAN
ncbi:hypothetical protein ACU8NW_10485 [Rhizobium leguminosarum]